MAKTNLNEDKIALLTGCFIFLLAALNLAHLDVLGWVVSTNMWTSMDKAFSATTGAYKGTISGVVSLLCTYVALTAILSFGIKLLGGNVARFVKSFTVVFFISEICYMFGANAHIAATPDAQAKFGIDWSIGLTTEAGFIVALVAGIFISNAFPRIAESLHDACRPELFVKIAIVVLGAELGVKAAAASGMAGTIIFRGLCAIVEAYLLYWAFVYYVARKYFKFSREWAVPLASGISICGVSAAIATGSSIRARPVVPIMVSSLIVVFTCIEMLILPFIASHFLYSEPMVAGGWMGLAVKSDGGAIASGAIADSLIRARALELLGVHWEAGWVTMVTTTVKIFIDVFIGVWSLVLAWVWTAKFDKTNSGRTMNFGDVLARFPRFVLGYLLTFVIMLFICVNVEWQPLGKSVISTLGPLRTIFFTLTFFTIGMVSNFHKLMEEGIGRLAIVYVVCLFGFIIWLGLFISWLFFHGMTPPVIAGQPLPFSAIKETDMAEDTKNVKFHEEVQKMEYEPLDATELKLIHWSWALGVFLLVALYFLSDFIAPGAHG